MNNEFIEKKLRQFKDQWWNKGAFEMDSAGSYPDTNLITNWLTTALEEALNEGKLQEAARRQMTSDEALAFEHGKNEGRALERERILVALPEEPKDCACGKWQCQWHKTFPSRVRSLITPSHTD